MAIRMQQRRGTVEQWTLANPVLAPGEIGFETDTNKFKLGDGISNWADLSYFLDESSLSGSLSDYVGVDQLGITVATLDVDGQVPAEQLGNATVDLTGYATEDYVGTAIEGVVGLAPETLDTLAELADALGDNPAAITTLQSDVTALQADKANSEDPELTINAVSVTDFGDSLVFNNVSGPALVIPSEVLDPQWEGGVNLVLYGNQAPSPFPTFSINDVVRISTDNSSTSYFEGYDYYIAWQSSTPSGSSYSWNAVFLPVTRTQDTDSAASLAAQSPTAWVDQSPFPTVTITKVVSGPAVIGEELGYLHGATSNIQTQLDAKLGSSDLTGYALETYVDNAVAAIPAPDLTGYATETYVNTAVSDLVASAPGALDTLNELAAALGDDENFATTVATSLSGKADLNSPTFTGLTDFQGIVDFSDAVVVGIDALPDQTGNTGKYLTTDGAGATWQPVAAAAPHPFTMIG